MITLSLKMDKKRFVGFAIAIIFILFFITLNCAKCNQKNDGQNMLHKHGLQVNKVYEQQITIPDEFDEVYNKYNELQKQQGYDLSRYKGKECKKVRYRIAGTDNMVADVIICKNKVIGGDIHDQIYGSSPRRFDEGVSNKWWG